MIIESFAEKYNENSIVSVVICKKFDYTFRCKLRNFNYYTFENILVYAN